MHFCVNNLYTILCELQFHSHSEKSISDSFQTKRNTIVVTVFLLILNQTEFHWVHNQKKNCHYDRFLLNLKGIRKKFL